MIPKRIAPLHGQAFGERPFVSPGARLMFGVAHVGITVFEAGEGFMPSGQVDEAHLRANFTTCPQRLPFR